jgi:hypothetical protein
MKTPMQELLEWVRATLPMDLETPRLIEQKIESMLEKEKEVITSAYNKGKDYYFYNNTTMPNAEEYYNKTFNTK